MEYKIYKKDERAWGKFEQYTQNEKTTVKLLYIESQQRLSKQVHKNRDELWIILDENLQVEIDGFHFNPEPDERFFIKKGQSHRLTNIGFEHNTPARVLEISFGDFNENDELRLEDDYNRVS